MTIQERINAAKAGTRDNGGRPQVAPTGAGVRAGLEPAPTGGRSIQERIAAAKASGGGGTGGNPSGALRQLPSVGEPRGAVLLPAAKTALGAMGANRVPVSPAAQELYGGRAGLEPAPTGARALTTAKKVPDYTAMLQGSKVSPYGALAFDAQAGRVTQAAERMKEIEKQIEDTYGEAARTGEITGPSVMQLEQERKGIEERYPSLKRPGFLPWAGKTLEAGLQQTGSGLAATYDFLTGGKVGFISDANRDLRTASQETTRLADEMSEKKGGLYPIAGKLAQGTVGALPNAALALATGGASVPAQLGAQTAGLGATLTTAVGTLAKNPGFWMANAQTLGNSYESAKAGGANEVEATATALLNSLLSSAVEVGGGIETLPAALARDTSEAGVRKWVRSMLEEGGEEVVQGVIENMTQMAIYDHDKPVFSMKDEGAVINPGRMAGEFAMGAGVGGILGGGQMLANGAVRGAGDGGRPQVAPTGAGTTGANPSVPAGQLPSVGEPRGTWDGPLSPAEPIGRETPHPSFAEQMPPSPQGEGLATGDVFGQQKTASPMEAVQDYQRYEHHGEILDTVRANLRSVAEIQPVASLTGREFQKTEGDTRNMRKKVIDFFSSIGNKVTRADMGEIELNTSGARDSLAHGYGRLKAVTFAALPNVLEQGKIISHKGPYEGHNYDSYVISAPVTVDGETVYVGALIIKDRTQRYKLHEVLTTNENGVSLFKSETTSQGADGPLRNDTPLGEPEGSPTDTKIPQMESGVKGQDMQLGGKILLPGADAEYMARHARKPLPRAEAPGMQGDGEYTPPAGTGFLPRAGEVRTEGLPFLPRAGEATQPMAPSLPGARDTVRDLPRAGEDTGMDAERWNSILGEAEPQGMDEKTKSDPIASATQALDDWEKTLRTSDVAGVRTKMPEQARGTMRETAEGSLHNLYRKFVDSGETVDRIGKALGDKHLYAYYNFARASSNAAGAMLTKGGAQTDTMGLEVGKSLADIFDPIQKKGDEYYQSFETYLFHRHNISRMSRDNNLDIARAKEALDIFDEGSPEIARMPESDLAAEAAMGNYEAQERMSLINAYNRAKLMHNKPVFGHEVRAVDSASSVAQMEQAHPEFAELAEGVYQYNRNLMQYRVDSDLITNEQAERIEGAYPDYVPTYRLTEEELARERKKGKRVSSTVGRAQGGNADLMPLHVAMARQTMQVVRNGAINRFGTRLLGDYDQNRGTADKYIYKVEDAQHGGHPDTFDLLDDPTPKKENTFTVYRDGKAVQMTVEKGLYEGVAELTPEKHKVMDADFWKPAEAATRVFKALVTGYNPMFSARNFARDLQEAGLHSKDLGAWAQNYPLAVKELATNGAWWRRYQALGGVYSSVFDYNKGYDVSDKEHGAVRKNTLDRVAALNMAIEQAPRLAEFMAQAKKSGEGADGLMDAMYAAASVTTNFGRSGVIGKFLNRTAVPFLNPSIQGADKMVRRFFGKKSGKEWASLVARCVALGIAPAIINELLNGDEPEWETVRQSDKDVNWLIGIGDGKYIKIPKGRDMSVVQMLAGRVGDMVTGKEVDWGGTLTTAANQIAPPNPLENNIYAAIMDADLFDPQSPGKTWYGGNIEGQRLQGYAPGQRYDEDTDALSKAVGGALGVSPKKLNYILDQYSGVVGDFVLPMLTPSGNKNPLSPFSKAFVLDSVGSNRLSGDFYGKTDEITYAKNAGDGAMSVVQRFWNKQAGAISDVYTRVRETENSKQLPNAAMLEQVRQDKGVINGIQQNALDVLTTYEAAVRKHYTGDSDEEKDEAYRAANREVFGAEYALQTYNKSVYARAKKCNQAGVGYDDYYDVYFSMREKETANEKRKVLIGADLSDEEKVVLYRDRISDKRDDDIAAVLGTGLEFDDFLEAQNKYDTLYNQKGSASEKGTDFAHWASQQGYNQKQSAAVREAFKFYSSFPSNELKYDKLLGAGFSEEQSYALSEKLASVGGIKGDKDASGNAVTLSASRKKKDAIDAATGTMNLTVQQRMALYELFDVSEKVWGRIALPTAGGTTRQGTTYVPKSGVRYLPR